MRIEDSLQLAAGSFNSTIKKYFCAFFASGMDIF